MQKPAAPAFRDGQEGPALVEQPEKGDRSLFFVRFRDEKKGPVPFYGVAMRGAADGVG
jgi:hypothetical protein